MYGYRRVHGEQGLNSESDFAALCGVSPVSVSSGKTNHHRLSRGDDRAANSALHLIAIGRLRTDTRTQEYVAKRVAEGHSKIGRSLKCHMLLIFARNPTWRYLRISQGDGLTSSTFTAGHPLPLIKKLVEIFCLFVW